VGTAPSCPGVTSRLLAYAAHLTVRPEPFDPVHPELVEGTNGAQDRLVEGFVVKSKWFDKLTTNG